MYFFLEGMRLEEFARDAIGKAKDEILVTIPFVDSCFLRARFMNAYPGRDKTKMMPKTFRTYASG